ncbi:RNA polymerase sigma-70 factor, ECF subfamily, putative [Fulvivirga imtechensis AK7]|uniref:RNA polymerase sigma-70 factor, ECF subfamily, putative n=1 Tax=Fulvivirga imtechensis AK7 TaxID=1237149 RepID=L8JUG5_9BACT|nr:sigma-70 family RNA polymerase sigma factor [Fulvivirga imtechensis]ELR70932.1 RNA polymerase sigma-70 factor, ECF subfamily, putative [Fulvivirga imtechensis AK7]
MEDVQRHGIAVDDALQQVRQGDDHFLRQLYETNRTRFIKWFQQHHRITENEAIDLYQKTFTIFYFNVKDGKITTLKSNISTYLFGIGKNLVRELFRQQKQQVQLDDVSEIETASYEFLTLEEEAHQQGLVKKILDKLEEPCKSILLMYYFKNFSMESIATNLGYKNEGVAKKKKCLCLKKIREELLEYQNDL